jgi:membrane protease subunit HflK
MTRWGSALLSLTAFAWIATGVAVIRQDEIAVVRRFGAVLPETWQPGLHWGLPWPLDRVDRLKVAQTRTLTVGAASPVAAPLSTAPDPEADDVLTGDLNLVTAQATLQYRVSDPVSFLYRTASVETLLAAATEAALTEALGGRGVDEVLTTGRNSVADQMSTAIQQQADFLKLGVSIRAVRLGRVAPPLPVADAFADAARARSDKRQFMTAAEEYRDRTLSEARGQAVEVADRAAARQDRDVQLARGESDRFTKLLAEASLNREATRQRLYLETISQLLPRFSRKVVIEPGESLDLGMFAEEPAAEAAVPAPTAP